MTKQNMNKQQKLQIEQYLTLCKFLTEHKHLLMGRQRGALLGMQRKLQYGECDEQIMKRVDGLFKSVQKRLTKQGA